ncbi:metal-dependent phosphohydrolase [Vibrio albus]|uniref:Metal-dependent phosphohydrolase n=1 Tax=Vibrio albus TaxID=2200953 RepID=A0A2U3B6N1_9VIBR|nr:HD domain-containing phosphohydrolase [Vibrio albus]PWI32448.1 metal-dependent phosphohydrolase [Vibrio albus]
MAERNYSLNIHITSLFILLVLILGGTLIAISYVYSQHLFSKISQNISQENSSKLERYFENEISPIITTLDVMATLELPQQSTNINPHSWLRSVQLVFDKNPNLSALYYGSSDGTSTQFRPLKTPLLKRQFEAPSSTNIMLNYTSMAGRNDYLFYDHDLMLTETRTGTDNRFDPRVRPWFRNADREGKIGLTNPYQFYYLKVPGITLSRLSTDGNTVVAADFTLENLSGLLKDLAFTRESKLALFDSRFQLLAGHQITPDTPSGSESVRQSMTDSVFSTVLNRNSSNAIHQEIEYEGETWSVTLTPINLASNVRLFLAEAIPSSSLLSDLMTMRNYQIAAGFALLFICLILIWQISARVTLPLNTLSELTENIRNFNFKKTRYPRSMIKEVNSLTHSIQLMEHTLHDLLGLLRETARNHEFTDLAKTIAKQSYLITHAETIMLYMLDDTDEQFSVVANHAIIPLKIDINDLINDTPWLRSTLTKGNIARINKSDNAIKKYQDIFYNTDLYLFPLLNRNEELVGILALGYERPIEASQKDKHAFLQELLGFAGISKDNIDQMHKQKQMLKSFIELIASAIDTKSPYTGLHCQRVPFIAEELTKIAEKDRRYFPEFSMSKQQWEELSFASWMHDCGKVTTPEYVVDKATKLETLYNRIHEIRTRFEVLKAQKEVRCWKEICEGGDKTTLLNELQTEFSTLDEEFTFVARCNKGDNPVSEEDKQRLLKIAERTWIRTLDNRIGTSWLEKQYDTTPPDLPAKEPLLADKDAHMVPWEASINPTSNWNDSFNLKPGPVQYNRGELHNLMIPNGTLTKEERFMINNHIVQTINMLQCLPYPEHLKNVPDIAGNHHERMDGKGYPRGLDKESLSVQERVMAIADVFEALTSSDRPYKKAHSLGGALAIMTDMATSGHIDPELYLLFLEHEIDKDYAKQFLCKEQQSVNEDERDSYIRKVKNHLSDYI